MLSESKLRDHFAGLAMQAHLITDTVPGEACDALLEAAEKHGRDPVLHLSMNAYVVADAMMVARGAAAPKPAAAEPNALDLFAETSNWSKRTGGTITSDMAALVGWLTVSVNRWIEKMEEPAMSTVPTRREFTNELGNSIRIVIEGPTSVSENILTPEEATQLRSALNEHAAPAALERKSQITGEDRQLAATFGVMEGLKVIALILGGRGRLEELTAAMSGPLEAIERAHGTASGNEGGAAC